VGQIAKQNLQEKTGSLFFYKTESAECPFSQAASVGTLQIINSIDFEQQNHPLASYSISK